MGRLITFYSLVKLITNSNKPIHVRLENFKRPFISNYGEIPEYINAADNDPWDIIIPGYPPLETNKSFKIKEFLGVYKLPNGNHKLIIDIHDTLFHQDKERIKREVEIFKKKYEARTKLVGNIVYF